MTCQRNAGEHSTIFTVNMNAWSIKSRLNTVINDHPAKLGTVISQNIDAIPCLTAELCHVLSEYLDTSFIMEPRLIMFAYLPRYVTHRLYNAFYKKQNDFLNGPYAEKLKYSKWFRDNLYFIPHFVGYQMCAEWNIPNVYKLAWYTAMKWK